MAADGHSLHEPYALEDDAASHAASSNHAPTRGAWSSGAIHERPLALAAEWAFQFIGTLAPDGTLLDANRSALAFAGARLEDVVGLPFWETPWWPTEESRAWAEHAIAEAASGKVIRSEVEHASPDGRRIIVDFSLTPVRDELGRVYALSAEGRDVTDRKHADDERRSLLAEALAARRAAEVAERRARFLADATQVLNESLELDATFEGLGATIVPAMATFCIIDVVDEHGVVRRLQVVHERPEMREVARQLAQYPRGPNPRYMTSDSIARGRPRFVRRVDEAFFVSSAEDAQHLALLRTLAPASFITVPLVTRGRILGAIAFCRDATAAPYNETDLAVAEDLGHRAALALDNARLYEQSRRSTQARDDMLGLVSHDLRNPLSAISMCVHALLEHDEIDAAGRADLLRTMRDATDWAHRMIEDLLDVSAIEAGQLSIERRIVDPVLLAVQAAQMFERLAQEQGITLYLDLPEHLPRVHADAERLLQALGNLLGNALKFTPSGGRVGLHGAADGENVVLSVTDTGPGVPLEHVPYIFDRYWHSRRTAKKRGTGLGLAIVKGIVDAHNGKVWVESIVGGGSRFSISLPSVKITAPRS